MNPSTITEISFAEHTVRVMHWHGPRGVREVAWKLAGQGAWHPLAPREAMRPDFVTAAVEAAETYLRTIERRRRRLTRDESERRQAAGLSSFPVLPAALRSLAVRLEDERRRPREAGGCPDSELDARDRELVEMAIERVVRSSRRRVARAGA